MQAGGGIGRATEPGEGDPEKQMGFWAVGQFGGGLHGRLEGLGEAAKLEQELAQEQLGIGFAGIDRHGRAQRGLRLVGLAKVEQGAGEVKMQSGMLRPGLEGVTEAREGLLGPPLVEMKQSTHEVVVGKKTGTQPGAWP